MKFKNLILVALPILVISCSKNGSHLAGTAGSISGTAAIGAPMSGAKITIQSPACNGALAKVSAANANGVYSVPLAGCVGPFLISAESASGKVYSVATDEDTGGIVNITPLTQLVASRVLATTDFDAIVPSTGLGTITKANVDQEVTVVSNIISGLASSFGAGSVDIRKGSFDADGTGLDKILDSISIQPGASGTTISLKGSATTVSVPMDRAQTVTGSIAAGDITAASAAMTEFELMKTSLMAGLNACLAAKDPTCFAGFFDAGYEHNGANPTDEWADIYWTGMDVTYSNPVLVSINPGRTEAWIAFTTTEKQEDTGAYGNWLDVTKVTKTSGSWKVLGNQLPQKFNLQPGLIRYGTTASDIKRGVNFRIWNTSDVVDNLTFKMRSTDLGITEINVNNSNDSTWEYFNHDGAQPNCAAAGNNECKSFLVVDGLAASAIFPKVELSYDGGSTWETVIMPSIPSLPISAAAEPAFTNLSFSENLCLNYTSGSPFPDAHDTLDWTLPTGYTNEFLHFKAAGSYTEWDIDGDINTDATSSPFGNILGVSSSYAITFINMKLETRDSLDRPFFLAYHCAD